MPLLETLALSFGPSIAKAIVKTWLGQGWKTDLAGSLVDLAKGQSEKALAQRDRQPQIDKIGEQIATRMHTLFKSEGARLDEDERNLVAHEVALTLAQSNISASLLIEHNLNPQRLARHLIGLRPDATRPLSTTQAELYERTLTEAARAIVGISTELPGFEQARTATQLYTEDQILEGLAKLLTLPDQQAQHFEQKYCEAIKQKLDKMEIFGVPSVDPLVRRQSLSVAYITLDVDQGSDKAERDESDFEPLVDLGSIVKESDLVFGSFTRDTAGSIRFRELIPIRSGPVDRVLALSRRLVIRGQAGSGKSTLLQWIAVRSASHDLPPHLASWNNTVPLFIRLRSCVNAGFPATEEFPRQVAPMIGNMPHGWVDAQLECGRAVVLIDGVDELPREQRSDMLDHLRQLVALYPLARYIVTSRPAALKAEDWPEWQEWIEQEGFIELNLQPMSTDQIESLIDHWHDALAQSLADEQERDELKPHPASLKRLLRQRLPLRRLATSPLLCGMICALHRERRQSLPAERLQLYRQCVEMLLSGREEVRKLSFGQDYPDLSYDQKLALIQHLAYWLMLNNYSDAEASQADDQFNNKLALMNKPNVTGQGVRCLFVDRTSLLREPVAGRIDFTHRTFQEFLAAQAAVKEGHIGLLVQKGLDDQWREMIVLAAGEARPREREELLTGLIRQGDTAASELDRKRAYLLACACLETCVELAPSVRELVLQKAAVLIPPKDDDEVKLIAAAGDPIVPLLKADPQHDERRAARCVVALALIGSDAAMSMLAEYATDARREVRQAIGDAWNSFDRQKYAQQVLARSDKLVLPDLASWEGFEHLRHVAALTIWGEQIRDISSLANLINLKELDISGTQVSDLSPLAGHIRLTTLIVGSMFDDMPVNDLGPLANLTNLTRLDISGTQVSDLSPLANLTNLDWLDISVTQVSDISPLTNLRNLVTLHIIDVPIKDFSPLASLTNLTRLGISGTQITDLNMLASLTNLASLTVGDPLTTTPVSDLSPLASLTKLLKLDISCTLVSDLGPLVNLTSLKELFIKKVQDNDISILTRLPNLEILRIAATKDINIELLKEKIGLRVIPTAYVM